MATSDQVKALIKSHVEDDEDRFLSVAMQVAANAARQGHGRVADEIRVLVDTAKTRSRRGGVRHPIPIATPKGEVASLLAVSYPRARLADMVLTDDVKGRLERILREHRAQEKLRAHGLEPRRKLLLVGPPGCGKTMTAAVLAGELRLPLYGIVLHRLITKLMGETAAKLRLVFDAAADQRGVYLFDELDGIGGERASGNDVGEIRRVLNSFLQFLEQDESQSLVIAATNHATALDRALFRRFDDVIEYELPSPAQLKELFAIKLAPFALGDVDWSRLVEAANGLSHADVTRACEAAAKEAVLSDQESITNEVLLRALQERRRVKGR